MRDTSHRFNPFQFRHSAQKRPFKSLRGSVMKERAHVLHAPVKRTSITLRSVSYSTNSCYPRPLAGTDGFVEEPSRYADPFVLHYSISIDMPALGLALRMLTCWATLRCDCDSTLSHRSTEGASPRWACPRRCRYGLGGQFWNLAKTTVTCNSSDAFFPPP